MPCFYCGKNISLVRRLADPDFCSEDHRRKYHEMTRLGLNRLLETRDRLEAAPKRKRPRAAAAVEAHAVPPVAELLAERVAPVAIVGQLSFPGEYAALSHTLRMPGIRPPEYVPGRSAGLRLPATVPDPVQAGEPPEAAASRQGAFLATAAPPPPSPPRLNVRAPLEHAGFPVQPIQAPRRLEATLGDGRVPAGHEALPAVFGIRLPPPGFALPAAVPQSATLLSLPAPGPAPPGPTSVAVAAAVPLDQAPPAPSPPAWQPCPVGLESLITAAAAPPAVNELFALPAPGAPLVAALPPTQTFVAPSRGFAARTPAPPVSRTVLRGCILASAPEAPVTAGLPAAPPAARTSAQTLAAFPPPPAHAPAAAFLPAARLPLGDSMLCAPAEPLPQPAFAITESGPGTSAATWDITFRHSSIWRLRPAEFELPSLEESPALSDWVPIPAPRPRMPTGQATAAPGEQWRQAALGLPRVGWSAGGALLQSPALLPLEAPAGQAGPETCAPRPGASPGFPIAWRCQVGWEPASLRRALGFAEPLALAVSQAHAAPPGLRESPTPEFRIAARAFTHAPSLALPAALAVGAALKTSTPPPRDSAVISARPWEQLLAPPAAAVLPVWRAELAEERFPPVREAPPPLEQASPLVLLPLSGRVAQPWQPSVVFPAPQAGWPAALGRRALPSPLLQSYPAHWVLALPPARTGAGNLHEMPAVEFAAAARLPHPQPLAVPVFMAANLAAASEALSPVAQGPTAGPPPPVEWQTPGAASARFYAIHPRLAPVGWAPADCWPEEPLETPAGGSGSPLPASVAISQPAPLWPPVTGIVARGPLASAPPRQLTAPPQRDGPVAPVLESEASVAVAPPATLALPPYACAAPASRLPMAPPAAGTGRIQDLRMVPQLPPRPTPVLSSLALPASTGIPGCAADLFCPYPAPVDPLPQDRVRAVRNQPKEVPIAPCMLLQARHLAPIPHRFERLPSEPQLSPALAVLRLWKRLPGRVVALVAALGLVALLGAVLWSPVREGLRQRATVSLEEGFTEGMARWTGGAADWSRDPTGFAQIGSLALLGPSLRMSDYRFEFMGEIERQSLAWVFRARDPENYYVMKIVVVEPGPLPTLALVHYRVLGGAAGPHVQVPLGARLHGNRPFRVQMRIRGSDFSTFIDQRQVDFWADDRFPSGGVGFFAEKGSRARLYWVKITHQDDLLGKLCSYFAPNDLSRNGSWK